MPDVAHINTTKPKLYSYVRWSSSKQEAGTSLDRQRKVAIELASQHGLELVEYLDSGISAYKGNNAKDGALADFIAAVKDGVISKDSWLCVENYDRLSRSSTRTAMALFNQIIDLGITIITPREIVSAEILETQPFLLMMIMVDFIRANEESNIKSRRTIANAMAIISRHKKGIHGQNGFPLAIKSTGSNMWWSDCSDGTVKPHEVYYAIAKGVVEMLLSGHSSYEITLYLNKEKIPLPRGKKGSWTVNSIYKFSRSRALLGEKTVTLDGVEYELDNYYPKLCSEEEFAKIQLLREARSRPKRAEDSFSIASGINITKCGHCGRAMSAHLDKKGTHRESLRFTCSSGVANDPSCRGWSFDYYIIEDTLIRLCLDKLAVTSSMPDRTKQIDFIGIKEQELKDVSARIERGADLLLLGKAPQAFMVKLKELEESQSKLKSDIEELRKAQVDLSPVNVYAKDWQGVDPKVLDYKQTKYREEIQALVKNTFLRIECKKDKRRRGVIHFVFKFKDGDEREAVRLFDKQHKKDELTIKGSITTSLSSGIETEALMTWGKPPSIIRDDHVEYVPKLGVVKAILNAKHNDDVVLKDIEQSVDLEELAKIIEKAKKSNVFTDEELKEINKFSTLKKLNG